MERIINMTKGQKILLFLFLISTLVFVYSDTLINGIKTVHSNVIIAGLENYQSEEIDGMVFYYKDIDEQYVDELTSITSDMVKQVNNNFNVEDTQGFNLVIYPNSVEMNKGLRLSSSSRTLGAYYGGNIFLLSPSRLDNPSSNIKNTVLHEYAHLILDEKTNGNYPTWFSEGIALHQEYLITGYEWGENLAPSKPYSMQELENDFYQLDVIKAYRDSYLRVKFLAEEYGQDFIFELIDELGKGKDFQNTVENLLDKSYKVLENEFILWIDGYFYGKL